MVEASLGEVIETLSQKQNKNKRGWRHGLSGRALVQQVQGSGCNLQYHFKKKKSTLNKCIPCKSPSLQHECDRLPLP
jgi:hypothetical protein